MQESNLAIRGALSQLFVAVGSAQSVVEEI